MHLLDQPEATIIILPPVHGTVHPPLHVLLEKAVSPPMHPACKFAAGRSQLWASFLRYRALPPLPMIFEMIFIPLVLTLVLFPMTEEHHSLALSGFSQQGQGASS